MIWLILKSIVACGWSGLTYAFTGVPKSKQRLPWFSQWFGFADKSDASLELQISITAYHSDPSFHHLKDVLVEWVRVWPQRAAKLGSAVIVVQAGIIWVQVALLILAWLL